MPKIRNITQSSASALQNLQPGSVTWRGHRSKEWLEKVGKCPCPLLPPPWKGSFPAPGEFCSRSLTPAKHLIEGWISGPLIQSGSSYKELCSQPEKVKRQLLLRLSASSLLLLTTLIVNINLSYLGTVTQPSQNEAASLRLLKSHVFQILNPKTFTANTWMCIQKGP